MNLQHLLLALVLLLAVFDGGNGLYMIVNPMDWYHAVPGVTATGPANVHFITDVGLAYLTSMALLIAAVVRPGQRGAFALAAALWPALHAGFHIAGDIAAGGLAITVPEAFGIHLPAIAQLALGAYWMTRR